MSNPFFDHPVLNSPYKYPGRHWELDETGQPTQKIIERRRSAEFITPIPKPRKRKKQAEQASLFVSDLSTKEQEYDHTATINAVRREVEKWRRLPSPNDWRVTPETARLLQYWRHHEFAGYRPFFCQIEAIETAIWLTEVAPHMGKAGCGFLEYLANANKEAKPDVKRLGRKTRLPESRRAVLWGVFEEVKASLREQGWVTRAGMFSRLAETIGERRHPPFEFAVVDEAQDIRVAQLRFLAALGGDRPNSLFFAGDPGQRIFQTPFSWKSLGVDIRGRSQTLRINYRTSHQIRMQADRLLGPEVADVDGNVDDRRGTISVFNGPSPDIMVLDSVDAEVKAVGPWLKARNGEGVEPREMAIFVRSAEQLERARAAARESGLLFNVLDERMETDPGSMAISTMHLAKGLEFRAVAVMACDDEVVPLQERIESVADDADLEEVYNTERHLLYVACTRARDHLLVTGIEPASEFLDDLKQDTMQRVFHEY